MPPPELLEELLELDELEDELLLDEELLELELEPPEDELLLDELLDEDELDDEELDELLDEELLDDEPPPQALLADPLASSEVPVKLRQLSTPLLGER